MLCVIVVLMLSALSCCFFSLALSCLSSFCHAINRNWRRRLWWWCLSIEVQHFVTHFFYCISISSNGNFRISCVCFLTQSVRERERERKWERIRVKNSPYKSIYYHYLSKSQGWMVSYVYYIWKSPFFCLRLNICRPTMERKMRNDLTAIFFVNLCEQRKLYCVWWEREEQ